MTPDASAAAPGRVNLVGEHTDYNGGLVLPAAIELETRVSVRWRADDRVVGRSRERGRASAERGEPARGDWLDYPRGVARELERAGLLPARGFELEVETDLPEGAGLSSSAALEAASALALLAAAGRAEAVARPELARLCQRAEADFVGVPCGIMDQYAVLCSAPASALRLDCASLEARPAALPPGLAFAVFDTGVARSLRAGAYAERRRECERARAAGERALARALGSLSELAPAELPALERALDPVAFRRARHVVGENARVDALAAALARGDLAAAGAAMAASHASLRDDYEVGWPEADAAVELSRALGCAAARMTGAGFGGCTVHLLPERDAAAFAAALAARFRERTGRGPRVWCTRASGPARVLAVR